MKLSAHLFNSAEPCLEAGFPTGTRGRELVTAALRGVTPSCPRTQRHPQATARTQEKIQFLKTRASTTKQVLTPHSGQVGLDSLVEAIKSNRAPDPWPETPLVKDERPSMSNWLPGSGFMQPIPPSPPCVGQNQAPSLAWELPF